jgi:hypothetical protein
MRKALIYENNGAVVLQEKHFSFFCSLLGQIENTNHKAATNEISRLGGKGSAGTCRSGSDARTSATHELCDKRLDVIIKSGAGKDGFPDFIIENGSIRRQFK